MLTLINAIKRQNVPLRSIIGTVRPPFLRRSRGSRASTHYVCEEEHSLCMQGEYSLCMRGQHHYVCEEEHSLGMQEQGGAGH